MADPRKIFSSPPWSLSFSSSRRGSDTGKIGLLVSELDAIAELFFFSQPQRRGEFLDMFKRRRSRGEASKQEKKCDDERRSCWDPTRLRSQSWTRSDGRVVLTADDDPNRFQMLGVMLQIAEPFSDVGCSVASWAGSGPVSAWTDPDGSGPVQLTNSRSDPQFTGRNPVNRNGPCAGPVQAELPIHKFFILHFWHFNFISLQLNFILFSNLINVMGENRSKNHLIKWRVRDVLNWK